MRKPKGLNFNGNVGGLNVYAGLYDEDDCDGRSVYIGGDYYCDTAQIHLNRADVIALSAWLNKVTAWMKTSRKTKRAGNL